tara:strand:+ start:38904 stop:39281 length:378 start_codon:yes stop_codon:yes gene_type:complete
MRIDHINFNVSNLQNSVNFYSKIFGLSEKESGISKASGKPYKIIGHPDKFYLCLYESNSQVKQQGLNHFGIHVEDFAGIVQKLHDEKVEILYGGITEWENSKSAYINGPDQEEIEITQFFGGKLN